MSLPRLTRRYRAVIMYDDIAVLRKKLKSIRDDGDTDELREAHRALEEAESRLLRVKESERNG